MKVVHGVECHTAEQVLKVLRQGALTGSECRKCESLLFESEYPQGLCEKCERGEEEEPEERRSLSEGDYPPRLVLSWASGAFWAEPLDPSLGQLFNQYGPPEKCEVVHEYGKPRPG